MLQVILSECASFTSVGLPDYSVDSVLFRYEFHYYLVLLSRKCVLLGISVCVIHSDAVITNSRLDSGVMAGQISNNHIRFPYCNSRNTVAISCHEYNSTSNSLACRCEPYYC